jgi:hypothetical protein
MADPQKLQQLVSETVSARLGQLQQVLTDEIVSTLQGMLSAAEEKLSAAEEHAHELEEKLTTAHERVAKAEADLTEERSKPSAPEYAPGTTPTDLLNAAVASVTDARGQADILKATLDGIAQFASRTALYVVKGGQLTGWQSRGFENEGAIKGSTMSISSGLAGRAMSDREPVSAAAVEFGSDFVSTHGNPADGNATVLPLVVREKVSALVYVDGGSEGKTDNSAVQVLVRSAAMWLEILALRKLTGGAAEAEVATEAAPSSMASAAAAAAAPAPVRAAQEPVDAPAAAGDEEVHKKAKRFAKLLVDEIKLYNQKKVEEGKKNKDLYIRLKEDIDKSRQTYEKRWGSSAAASANYFQAELVRILADGDTSLMGAGF